MNPNLVIAPNAEPIDLAAAKLHLRVTDTDQDAKISMLLSAARLSAEGITDRQLLHGRFALSLDYFPGGAWSLDPSLSYGNNVGSYGYLGEWRRFNGRLAYNAIALPNAPVVRVISITYLDEAGATQTVDPATYTVNLAATPSLITPVYGQYWPITLRQSGAVTVTYDVGYASKFVADATANTLTVTGPVTWAVNDRVRLSNSGGALPAPLATSTDYYVKTAVGGVYTLAATQGGATIDLTDAGTGTSFIGEVPQDFLSWMMMRMAAMYENREEVVVATRITSVVLEFVDSLLSPYIVMGYRGME